MIVGRKVPASSSLLQHRSPQVVDPDVSGLALRRARSLALQDRHLNFVCSLQVRTFNVLGCCQSQCESATEGGEVVARELLSAPISVRSARAAGLGDPVWSKRP